MKLGLIVALLITSCGDDDSLAPDGAGENDGQLNRPCDFDNNRLFSASGTCAVKFDGSKIRVCPFPKDAAQVVVGGTPGAVAPGAGVRVYNFSNNEERVTQADIDGSFGLLIPGKLKDSIGAKLNSYNCVSPGVCLIVKECD